MPVEIEISKPGMPSIQNLLHQRDRSGFSLVRDVSEPRAHCALSLIFERFRSSKGVRRSKVQVQEEALESLCASTMQLAWTTLQEEALHRRLYVARSMGLIASVSLHESPLCSCKSVENVRS